MNKGLKIVYTSQPPNIHNRLFMYYNGQCIWEATQPKSYFIDKLTSTAESMSERLLVMYKVKYHPKNIERLIKEALRENNRGLRIEIIIEGKTILKISYNGKLLHQEAYVDWKGMAEICKGSGKKADLWSKDISELLRMNTDVKYHPENIKRILKDAWRNRKVVPVKSILNKL